MTSQEKTRYYKARTKRQDMTSYVMTIQDKLCHDITRQDITRQGITRQEIQDETRHYKTR